MPLTEVRGGIARILKEPGKERCLGIKPIGHVALGIAGHPGEVTVNVVTRREMPGHDRRPAGGTNATGHGEPVKVGSLPAQPVNIRRLNIGMTMATQISPTPVIGKDEENIGWRLIRRSLRGKPKNKQHQES